MTRVLIVLTSNQRRGAEVEGAQLAAELCRSGVAAEAVALHAAPAGSLGAPLEVPVLGSAPLAPATLRSLRRKAAGVDVVVAYGSSTLPACSIALLGSRTPFVYRSIGDPARWARGPWHRWRTGLLFRRAAHVVALWPGAADAISRLYRVPRSRISCIANARPSVVAATAVPSSSPTTSKVDARSSLGLPADARVVAWAGALSPEKRPRLAVDVVAATDDGFLVIAGDGPMRPEVEAACRQLLPGRHRLLGVLAPLSPLWQAADVVLLTSLTEGMPGVLIEAALHSVPAVAADVGAVRLVVVDHETGRVVAADGEPAEFAAALHDVSAHRVQMGVAAAAHAAAAFTWPVVQPQWLDVLNRL